MKWEQSAKYTYETNYTPGDFDWLLQIIPLKDLW